MKLRLSESQKRAITSLLAVLIVVSLPATSLAGIQPVRAEHENPESDLLDYTQTSLGPHVNIPNNHEINFTDLPRDNLAAIYESQDFDTEGKTIIFRYSLNITDCNANDPKGTFYTGITDIDSPSDSTDLSGLRIDCQELSVRNLFNGNNFHKSGQLITTINQNQEYDIEIRYNYATANMTIEVGDQSVTAQYPAAEKANIVAFVNDNIGSASSTISGRITDYSLNLIDIKNIGQDLNTYTPIDKEAFNVTKNWVSGSVNPSTGHGLYKDGNGANGDNLKVEYEIFISPFSEDVFIGTGVGYAPSDERVAGSIWDLNEVRQRNYYFISGAAFNPLGEKYYVTDYLYYNNGTHETYIYNNSDKSDNHLVAKTDRAFPAGENLSDIWAFSAFVNINNRVDFNIGNIEIQRTNTKNIGSDLNEWVESDPDGKINTTRNFVSYENVDQNDVNYLLNQSGPGTDTARLDFTVYVDSFGNRGFHYTGFSDSGSGGNLPGAFTGVFYNPRDSYIDAYINDTNIGRLLANFSLRTFYHITIKKKESEVVFEVYSDSQRNNLLNSISGPSNNQVNYEYIYAFSTEDSIGDTNDLSGMIHMGNISESVVFLEPYNGTIDLEANNWMDHGDTQTYKVIADNGTNVASESAVSSDNTTVISVNENSQTLVATSNENIAQKVEISAEYGEATDTLNITVANRTIDNIAILPPSQRPGAVIGIDDDQAAYGIGSEIQWILLAVFIGAVGAWKARNEWLGVGLITGALILFWTVGHVSLGYTIVGVFYTIFVGYQLVRTPSRSDTNVGGLS